MKKNISLFFHICESAGVVAAAGAAAAAVICFCMVFYKAIYKYDFPCIKRK